MTMVTMVLVLTPLPGMSRQGCTGGMSDVRDVVLVGDCDPSHLTVVEDMHPVIAVRNHA